MTVEFADALNEVIRELAEEIDWRYEGDDLMAAAPAIRKIERAVAILRKASFEPCQPAVDLLAKYKRRQN
ncbi:hypothetical protein HFO56_03000 [Rhizobium laguerreae]|uniref:hypothetical protein n=1 Tax=Rhizobium laguerreae TaxID=1076926 RepID=UPI001C920235|nr:hypothetical protein [Rhizobium laguerreae]MBY3151355.1 hypothetical protein [Rhizobium laguerreae]